MMRKLFNLLFSKSEPVKSKKLVDLYDVNGKRYAITDSMNIKVQASAEDVQVYGWTLEVRWKHNGEWHQWMTYWNHRIYQTRQSALDAAIKVYPATHQKDYEWRIAPLYKMNDPQFRDYQIDQLLNHNPHQKKDKEIKAWRVIEEHEEIFNNTNKVNIKKGTIFIQLRNGRIIKASTTTEPSRYGIGYVLKYLIAKEKVVEIDIREEKWIHPHLCKELKTKLKNK